MRGVEILTALGVLAAWAGVVINFLQNRRTRAVAEEAVQLQRRTAKREEAEALERRQQMTTADVRARIGQHSSWKNPSLLVENEGPAVAEHVLVKVNGKEPAEPDFVVEALDAGRGRLLPNGEPLVYHLALSMDSPREIAVEVEWQDGTGEHQEEFILPL